VASLLTGGQITGRLPRCQQTITAAPEWPDAAAGKLLPGKPGLEEKEETMAAGRDNDCGRRGCHDDAGTRERPIVIWIRAGVIQPEAMAAVIYVVSVTVGLRGGRGYGEHSHGGEACEDFCGCFHLVIGWSKAAQSQGSLRLFVVGPHWVLFIQSEPGGPMRGRITFSII
jgi:hypothetical protein